MIKLVKYGNRKIYNSYESRYVTLPEILSSVRAGLDVQVIDHKTRNDITAEILANALAKSRRLNYARVCSIIREEVL